MLRTALLVLLVVVTLPASAAGPTVGEQSAPDAGSQPTMGDIESLTLDASTKSGFATPSTDVSMAVSMQRTAAAARIDRYTLDAAFQRASDEAHRRELLFEAATNVEIDIVTLKEDERALRRQYVNGTIDTAAYLDGLARVDARAAQLRLRIERIRSHSDIVPGLSLHPRLDGLETALVAFEGPARDRASRALRGTAPPSRLYVEASPNGFVVATLNDGQYIREAYRADHRTPDMAAGFGLERVVSRAKQLYPTAYSTSPNTRAGISAGVSRIVMAFPQASVTAYIDSDTRNVFYEVQEHRIGLLAPGPAVSVADNGTRLVVNRTYAGGPLRVATFDNDTGSPATATVFVDGVPVETGVDGVAWTLAPRGLPPTTVTAVRPGGNVTTTVRTVSPNPVNNTES